MFGFSNFHQEANRLATTGMPLALWQFVKRWQATIFLGNALSRVVHN
jgi:hypothetical protein